MNIELTKAEAIVLFEWLHNNSQIAELNDEAAKCVLWNIECQLERALVEPFKDKPIAGCFRIHIPVETHHSIQCVLDLEGKNVDVSGSSGERYLCREFCAGTTMLAIGMEDENPAFESVRVENGMECCINGGIDEVVFGIAWATDYEGTDDVRVWFAADPTVYFKTER